MPKTKRTTTEHTIKLTPELGKFVENLGRYFESYGIPRIGGRILGLLLAAQGPLSAEDLAANLKVSRASISTNMRMLLHSGLAEKVSFAGDRVTYYNFPEAGLEKTLTVEIQGIGVLKKFAEQGLAAVPPGSAARGRMEAMLRWTDFLIQVWQRALIEWREQEAAG